MKHNFIIVLTMLVCFLFITETSFAADWRFPINLTYANGMREVFDVHKESLENRGYSVSEEFFLPVAVSFQPYVQLAGPLRVGGGIGPLMLVMIGDYTYFGIPLNLNMGLTFAPQAAVSPYIRVGLAYHLAFGDFVESTTPGLFGAFGFEFMRTKKVGFGLEIGLDSSKSKLEYFEKGSYGFRSQKGSKSVSPGGLLISAYVVF